MEEVKEVAAACTNGDVYGYGLCGTNYSNFSFQYITMLRSSGSDILNADNSASELGNSVAVETAQLYKDLAAIPRHPFWKMTTLQTVPCLQAARLQCT